MDGTLERLAFPSEALEGNPLGDPSTRTALVYRPPGAASRGLPAVYFLHGFGASVESWAAFGGFSPNVPERLDALVSSGAVPPVVGVFVDGWTSLGGTQWDDSEAIGRYRSYVARDVVRAVDERLGTLARPEARAVVGKSSGGYGALVLGREHPDVFGHVAAHAPDACFEYCYHPDFPRAAAALQGTDAAAWMRDLRRRARETRVGADDFPVLSVLAMAAAYSPRAGAPLGADLPFEVATGRLRPEVWARWLERDPVRFVPAAIAGFRRLGGVFLDCGVRDEFHLRWGARMIAEALRAGGVDVVHEEFDDGHRGIDYRFERSLSWLVPRLGRGT